MVGKNPYLFIFCAEKQRNVMKKVRGLERSQSSSSSNPKAWFPYDRPDRPDRPSRFKIFRDDPDDWADW